MVLRLGELNELVTVAKSRLHSLIPPEGVLSVNAFHEKAGSVKNSFRSVLTLPKRAASAAILPSALLGERSFARCQLGVLVSVGAAT